MWDESMWGEMTIQARSAIVNCMYLGKEFTTKSLRQLLFIVESQMLNGCHVSRLREQAHASVKHGADVANDIRRFMKLPGKRVVPDVEPAANIWSGIF